MSKKWFLAKAVVTLVVVGLLAMGGFAVYRTSWSQGYAAAQLGAEGEEGTTTPWSFDYPGRPFGFTPRPFGAGLLVTVTLALLFFAVIGKLIRFIVWGPAWRFGVAGPRFRRGAGWHSAARWHRMHGPVPPWCWGWEEPHEEQTGAVEPEADTGKSEA